MQNIFDQHFFTDAKLFLRIKIFLYGYKMISTDTKRFLWMQNIIDPNFTP